SENGIHTLAGLKRDHKCLVHAGHAEINRYKPPPDIGRRGGIDHQVRQRRYDPQNKVAEDYLLKKEYPMGRDMFSQLIGRLCDERLDYTARLILND
ncbi:MAG TPA: hypothetical protein VJX67_25045, partial [Blastocatellia bacterium]|nr:hypothetical protein [Blastocatellia bacterium]